MRRRVAAAVPVVALLLLAAAPAPRPTTITLDDLPAVTDALLEDAVTVGAADRFGYAVQEYTEPYLRIHPLATEETDGGETVVTLETDILFAVDDATLSDTARTELGRLVADLPEGVGVTVEGHTDSVGSDEHNHALSERRAASVADALRDARPGLALTAVGYGESRPKVEEGGDDLADDRALNRRVELRHTSVAGGRATPVPSPEPVLSTPPRTGTSPQVLPSPEDVTPSHEVRVPAVEPAGAELVVGIEEIVVRGAVTQLSLHVRLVGVPEGDDEAPDVHGALGGLSSDVRWDPVLIDREAMLRYGEVRVQRLVHEWAGEGDLIGTTLQAPRRFTISYPVLLGDAGTVDVQLGSGLPTITGVPVEVEQ